MAFSNPYSIRFILEVQVKGSKEEPSGMVLTPLQPALVEATEGQCQVFPFLVSQSVCMAFALSGMHTLPQCLELRLPEAPLCPILWGVQLSSYKPALSTPQTGTEGLGSCIMEGTKASLRFSV